MIPLGFLIIRPCNEDQCQTSWTLKDNIKPHRTVSDNRKKHTHTHKVRLPLLQLDLYIHVDIRPLVF